MAYPLMRHLYAQSRVPGALPCTFRLLHVPCAQPWTASNHQPLSIPIQSWSGITKESQTHPGVVSPGLSHLTYR